MKNSPVIEIDARSGFCHGVVTAIRKRFLQRGIILWMVNARTAAKKILVLNHILMKMKMIFAIYVVMNISG